MTEEENLLTAREVVERFGIPRWALYRLVQVGKVHPREEKVPRKPWHKTDHKRLLFSETEVAAALADRA